MGLDMDIVLNNLGIYNVDVDYLRYLHDNADNEVYYSPLDYNTKPFLGIIVGVGKYTYFIPFSSSKVRHLKWKNVSAEHYLIYEVVDQKVLSKEAICKPYSGNLVLHILAVLDIKKMIPVPDGLYKNVDFSAVENLSYKNLLVKEYKFCLRVQSGIVERVKKIYTEQKDTGIVHKFYCNFSKLEEACDTYNEDLMSKL